MEIVGWMDPSLIGCVSIHNEAPRWKAPNSNREASCDGHDYLTSAVLDITKTRENLLVQLVSVSECNKLNGEIGNSRSGIPIFVNKETAWLIDDWLSRDAHPALSTTSSSAASVHLVPLKMVYSIFLRPIITDVIFTGRRDRFCIISGLRNDRPKHLRLSLWSRTASTGLSLVGVSKPSLGHVRGSRNLCIKFDSSYGWPLLWKRQVTH